MISAVVFSKDRACQLDLFLRSVTCHASDLFESISVIWKASSWDYLRGYTACQNEHPDVFWDEQMDFQIQTLDTIDILSDHITFFTDDSVFYRQIPEGPQPDEILALNDAMLCFSFRLGLNTGMCYPLRRNQNLPDFHDRDGYLLWAWPGSDADFGYPGSVDGHVFRKSDLMDMVDGRRQFGNPNQLEEIIAAESPMVSLPFMGCYGQSHLVGIPVNRVNDTHPNRFGDYHPLNQADLNYSYLDGRRLSLDSIKPGRVAGAHTEMNLEWE